MSKIKNIFMLALIALFAFSACNNLDDTDINPIEPPKEDGNGSLEKPYTVGQAILKQGETDKWVSGYIVGSVNSVLNENVWAFEPPFVTESNILLAASPTETDKAKILPIQLVAGTDIRAFLNLPKNPTRLGQVIKIKGELIKYFGVPGLKSPTDLVAEGYDPTNPPSEGDKVEVCGDQTTVEAGFTYDFNNVTDGQDFAEKGWQNLMIAGGRKWQGKLFEGNGYVQATAHNATADQLQEMWLITPALNLDLATDKIATFETAQAYWKEDTKFEVYVLQCVDGKTIQTKVTPTALATSATPQFEFVPGAVDLSTYTGKVFIGFRYIGMGGQGLSSTWCVDNFAFGVPLVNPDPPVIEGGTKEDPYTVAEAINVQGENQKWVSGYIVGCVKNGTTVFDNPDQALFDNFDSSTNVFIADSANEKDYTKCICVRLNDKTAPSDIRNLVNLKDNPTNKGKVLLVEGNLRPMFTNLKGIRDISNYLLK